MSNRDSCTHHFEHVKQTRPFTEREYMECAKCGLQNPLGLFQHMSRYETEDIPGDYGLPVRTNITRDNGDKLPTGPTEADYQQAWDAIRAAAKPAIEHTLKVWVNMRHDRPLMNAIGIYRLPGDKPLIHNGKAYRK